MERQGPLEDDKEMKHYPFCLNSKRWITTFLAMSLPKSCPYETEKDCIEDGCAYFELRQPTKYLLRVIEIFKKLEMDIIAPAEGD